MNILGICLTVAYLAPKVKIFRAMENFRLGSETMNQ